MSIDVEDRLIKFARSHLPGDARDVRVTSLTRLVQGFARDNWAFDIAWAQAGIERTERLILRVDPVASVLDTDRRVEFGVLEALSFAPAARAPRARWLDADGSVMGRPALVMDRIDQGVCDWFVLNGSRPLAARLDLARRYVDLLAAVHSLDWRSLALQRHLPVPDDAAMAQLDEWEGILRVQALEPQPELELVLRWLRANPPAQRELCLVHGDYKPGNVLIEGDEIVALLDWETAHLGDPVEDLGLITNPVRAAEHTIDGAWETDQIIDRYIAQTGADIDPDDLRFWNVFANLKLSIIALTGLRCFVSGVSPRVYWGPAEFVPPMFEQIGAT